MKIGLIDVDGHHFPNLALMKLSAYHKGKGDSVEWVNYWDRYDRVYCSKVFTFTPDVLTRIQADEVIKGGTGYNLHDGLFCDSVPADYSLYPMYPEAYGFLTCGCIRKCPWCVVPYKEGGIRPYCDIETVLQGRRRAILLDNNVLASDFGLQQIEKIVQLKCRVDFNQKRSHSTIIRRWLTVSGRNLEVSSTSTNSSPGMISSVFSRLTI